MRESVLNHSMRESGATRYLVFYDEDRVESDRNFFTFLKVIHELIEISRYFTFFSSTKELLSHMVSLRLFPFTISS